MADYRTWRVIKTAQVIPVLELLDDATRKIVELLAPAVDLQSPLIGRYVAIFYGNRSPYPCNTLIHDFVKMGRI